MRCRRGVGAGTIRNRTEKGQLAMRTSFTIPALLVTSLPLCFPLSAAAQQRTPPPDAGEGACMECHGELAQGARVIHGAVEMEACDTCHTATGVGHTFELPAPPVQACLDCHDDPREAPGHVHGPVAQGQCPACHDPHRSDQTQLLRHEIPELCFTCHDRVQERSSSGVPVRNVRQEIADAAVVHEAIEMGCDACHPSHSAAGERLFTETFPAGPYGEGFEGSYELCFGCHDEGLLDEDPEVGGTDFRNGGQSLHFVHVAQPKSRSCALCHSPHGGGDHLVRSSAVFGTWEMPVVYQATPGGGSCAPACHEKRFYQRLVEPADGEAVQH